VSVALKVKNAHNVEIIHHPSPNCDSRDGQAVDMLVLHYTGMPTAEDALNHMSNPEAKVSAHYMIDEGGKITQLVDESERAWHAGVSYWRGNTNINHRSVGIEIVNPGHEFGYRLFPDKQMNVVKWLSFTIMQRHQIPARNVVGHSDIAPERKEDPGELFDWLLLAREGIGLWSDSIEREASLHHDAALEEFGYNPDTERHEVYLAFQRRFCPSRMTGEWNNECQHILNALMAQID
jgi:N-acetylmuramoyl-L-alanine amidase